MNIPFEIGSEQEAGVYILFTVRSKRIIRIGHRYRQTSLDGILYPYFKMIPSLFDYVEGICFYRSLPCIFFVIHKNKPFCQGDPLF